MTPAEVQEVLDDIKCFPFGHQILSLAYDEELGQITASRLGVSSVEEKWYEEYPPEVEPADLHLQTFSQRFDPADVTEEDVLYAATELIGYAGAHEFIEWSRFQGRKLVDLHEEGADVMVKV